MTRIATVVLVLVALAAIPLLAPAQEAADEPHPLLIGRLGEALYGDCGLDKLTAEELDVLAALFTDQPVPSYLEVSAIRYLEAQEFRPVSVLAAVKTGTFSGDFDLIVADGYDTVRLDPWGSPRPLTPGTYWAKNTLSSWTIIRPDGEEQDYLSR